MKKVSKIAALSALIFVLFVLCVIASFSVSAASCGDNNPWSNWTEANPSPEAGMEIQKITGNYKYQIKETQQTTNGKPPAGEGWILANSSTSYSNWVVANTWTTTQQADTDTKQLNAKKTVYKYFHYCRDADHFAPFESSKYGEWPNYCQDTSDNKELAVVTSGVTGDSGRTRYKGKKCSKTGCPYYYYDGKETQYQYKTRTKTVTSTYYRLSEPQLCSQSDITNKVEAIASATVVPKQVTLYRYKYSAHVLGSVQVEQPATCTQTGLQYQVCSRCGARVENVIPMKDHQYSSKWYIDEQPSCTTAGSKSHHCMICGAKADVTAIPMTEHRYSGTWVINVEPTCTNAGQKSQYCIFCKSQGLVTSIPASGHRYEKVVTPATMTADGESYEKCSVCDASKNDQIIPQIATVKLNNVKYTYNGKTITPKVIVQDSEGKTLKKNVDYKVKYYENRSECGKHYVKVIFKGNYSGSKKLAYKVSLGAVTGLRQLDQKGIYFTWNKVVGATSYQVFQYNPSNGKWDLIGNPSVPKKPGSPNPEYKVMYFMVRAERVTSTGETEYGAFAKLKARVKK